MTLFQKVTERVESLLQNSLIILLFIMIKTYTQKDGTVWEWEETPKLVLALSVYNKLVESRRLSEDK